MGFPLARIAAVFSLAYGSVLDRQIRRYAGKRQSELGVLRDLWNLFRPGDVFLADRLMCSWTEMLLLQQRGVQSVTRVARRHADFRRGQRLGKDDHIVRWLKPRRPRTVDQATYNALPEFLTVRECRVRVDQPGFRVKTLVIATTLLDAVEHPRTTWPNCTGRGGTRNSTCGRSSRRSRWISCGARRPNWCGRSCGCTSWRTT